MPPAAYASADKRAELVAAATRAPPRAGLSSHDARRRRGLGEGAARQRLLLLQDEGGARRGGHRGARGGAARALRVVGGGPPRSPGAPSLPRARAARLRRRRHPVRLPARQPVPGAREARPRRAARQAPARACSPSTSTGPSEQFRALGCARREARALAADLVASVQGTHAPRPHACARATLLDRAAPPGRAVARRRSLRLHTRKEPIMSQDIHADAL